MNCWCWKKKIDVEVRDSKVKGQSLLKISKKCFLLCLSIRVLFWVTIQNEDCLSGKKRDLDSRARAARAGPGCVTTGSVLRAKRQPSRRAVHERGESPCLVKH